MQWTVSDYIALAGVIIAFIEVVILYCDYKKK